MIQCSGCKIIYHRKIKQGLSEYANVGISFILRGTLKQMSCPIIVLVTHMPKHSFVEESLCPQNLSSFGFFQKRNLSVLLTLCGLSRSLSPAIVCYYSVTFWQKSGASKSCLFYDCVHLNLDSLKFLLYTIAQWCFHMWHGSNDLNSHYISSISSPHTPYTTAHLAFFSAKIPLVFGIWIHICNRCGFHSALHWIA